MTQLQPPGCKLTLGYIDHRWKSQWAQDDPLLPGKLRQKHFSRVFGGKKDWKEALIEVHRHNWTRWSFIKHEHPLPAGVDEQTPGVIDDDIFSQLQVEIDKLPPLTR